MSTSTEVIAHHWAFAIFLIVAIGLCCLMLVGGWFLGGRARARSKNVPFESGIDSVGSASLRLSAKFYLVAMFFVIFDVEALKNAVILLENFRYFSGTSKRTRCPRKIWVRIRVENP